MQRFWSSAPSAPSARERMTQRRPTRPGPDFQPLPEPAGAAPYRVELNDVIGPAASAEIAAAGALRFHSVGDTGGWQDPRPQRRVAAAMAAALGEANPPRFFFHLGDVVYPHGERDHYRPQFHAAYADYTAPIFAVPGNHDAECFLTGELTLAPFRAQFCSTTPPPHEAGTVSRPQVAQPHLHFTLVHEWIRIVGLWANVPEGGQFADTQVDWLVGELQDAPPHVPVILAMHQPVYSADRVHGANLALVDLFDRCAERAGRGPDAFFSGHAHLYERFTRTRWGREIPHIVAGAGGLPDLHDLAPGVGRLPARFPGVPDVTLDACEDGVHGFLTVAARPDGAEVAYTAVGPDSTEVVDRFVITPAVARPSSY